MYHKHKLLMVEACDKDEHFHARTPHGNFEDLIQAETSTFIDSLPYNLPQQSSTLGPLAQLVRAFV